MYKIIRQILIQSDWYAATISTLKRSTAATSKTEVRRCCCRQRQEIEEQKTDAHQTPKMKNIDVKKIDLGK